MSNRINTYYTLEEVYDDPKRWSLVEMHYTLSGALANVECDWGYPNRIVRYAAKRLPEVVRQWDADGNRVK